MNASLFPTYVNICIKYSGADDAVYTFQIDDRGDLSVFRNGRPYTGPILEDHSFSNAPLWEVGQTQYLLKVPYLFIRRNGVWSCQRTAHGIVSTFPDCAVIGRWIYYFTENAVHEMVLKSKLCDVQSTDQYAVLFFEKEVEVYRLPDFTFAGSPEGLHFVGSFCIKWKEGAYVDEEGVHCPETGSETGLWFLKDGAIEAY